MLCKWFFIYIVRGSLFYNLKFVLLIDYLWLMEFGYKIKLEFRVELNILNWCVWKYIIFKLNKIIICKNFNWINM